MERSSNVTQGETHGPEQEPHWAGEEDPAVRDPRPDGPMDQEGDAGRAELGEDVDEQEAGGVQP